MLRGHGNTRSLTCPLHKWTWDVHGEMKGAPHFKENPCLHLRSWNVENWRGLLFAGKRNIAQDLANIGFESEINFEDYRYHHTTYHQCQQNWKTFMEVYGDDYHVAPAHPGLGKMVSLKNLKVYTGENWHIQVVESIENTKLSTTPLYEVWRKKCLEQGDGKLPTY
jgi:choline monooxygenase